MYWTLASNPASESSRTAGASPEPTTSGTEAVAGVEVVVVRCVVVGCVVVDCVVDCVVAASVVVLAVVVACVVVACVVVACVVVARFVVVVVDPAFATPRVTIAPFAACAPASGDWSTTVPAFLLE